MICPRGHRVIDSTGLEWTVVESAPGQYRYVYGRCDELPACPNLAAKPQPREEHTSMKAEAVA